MQENLEKVIFCSNLLFFVLILTPYIFFLLFLLENNYVFTTIVWLCTHYFTQSAPPKNTTGDT